MPDLQLYFRASRRERSRAVVIATAFAVGLCSLARGASTEVEAKCDALASVEIPAKEIGLPTGGARVVRAEHVPAGLRNPSGGYCLVQGEIASASAGAQAIKFSAALPDRWNGKMAQYAARAFGGEVVPPDSAELLNLAAPPGLIARGYVAFGSDNGHATSDALDASFALNPQELRNFAGEHLKKTHDAVLALIRLRYGRSPQHSYFLGGSEGGRQAFTAVQHYPQDYDGVIAFYPGHTFVADFMRFQDLRRAAAASTGAVGKEPVPVNHLAADIFLRFFVMQNPAAETLSFDPLKPGKYRARLQELSALLDRTSTDVDAFAARGGKWIVVHGLDDEGAPPATTIEYVETLRAKYGQQKLDTFMRVYLIPGYGHGSGTFNANGAPTLDALEAWVERGVAPETLTIVDANPEGHGRARPFEPLRGSF